jgi:hypothetical protein
MVAIAAWSAVGVRVAAAQEAPAPPVVDLQGDGVRVVAHDTGHRALAERVLAMFSETHAVVRLRLGRGVEGETRIALAAIRGGGHHPANAVGLARWSTRSIIIDPYRLGVTAPLQSVLAHEISHLVVGQASQGGAPAWFDEGVAEWIGAAYGLTDRAAFLKAELPHLKDLEAGFPHEPDASRIAYAASRETIDIIATRVGGDAVAEILRNLANGQPFREAVRRATGKGPGDWDVALHAHQAEKPSRIRQMFEANPALVWILVFAVMGLVSVYAAIVRRRIAQAKLDAAEPPPSGVQIPDSLPPMIDADAAMLEHEAEFSEPEDDEWHPDDDDDESWRGDVH